MAENFPGPYEVRMFYTTEYSSTPLVHEQRLNVTCVTAPDPGDDFDTISIENGIGSTSDLETELLAWIALLKPLYHSSTDFNYAELWKYTPNTYLSDFVSTYDISDSGVSGSSTVLAGQEIYVFRTAEGGIMRINLMESVQGVSVPKSSGDLNASQAALVNYVIDPLTGNYFLGRDTSFPFAFTRMYPGQNEAVFKRRFRKGL